MYAYKIRDGKKSTKFEEMIQRNRDSLICDAQIVHSVIKYTETWRNVTPPCDFTSYSDSRRYNNDRISYLNFPPDE